MKRAAPLVFSAIDQAVVSGSQFLVIVFLARTLPQAELGVVGYVLTVNLFLVIAAMTSVFQRGTVKIQALRDPAAYLSALLVIHLVLMLVGATVGAAFVWISLSLSGYTASIGLTVLVLSFLLAQQFADFRRRAAYMLSSPCRAMLISISLHGLRLAIIVYIAPTTANGSIGILALATLIALVPFPDELRAYLSGLSRRREVGREVREHLRESKWLMLSAPPMWAWGAAPTYLLGAVSGISHVGIFVAVRAIANVGNILMELLETIGATAVAKAFHSSEQSFRRHIRWLLVVGITLWGVASVVLIPLSGRLLDFVYGAGWGQYAPVLLAVWSSQLVIFIFRVNAIRLRTASKTRPIASGYFAGLIASAASTVVLVPWLGLLGAGCALVLGASSILLTQRLLSKMER